jgi:hypothetical protein
MHALGDFWEYLDESEIDEELIGKSLACRTHAGRCRRQYIL